VKSLNDGALDILRRLLTNSSIKVGNAVLFADEAFASKISREERGLQKTSARYIVEYVGVKQTLADAAPSSGRSAPRQCRRSRNHDE
jgi:hypothetical protein